MDQNGPASDIYQLVTDPGEAGHPRGERWRWTQPVGYWFPPAWESLPHVRWSASTWRVLAALLSTCDYHNQVISTYAALAQRCTLSKTQISRSMRDLTQARVVVVERLASHRAPRITLSPALVWRGRPWHQAPACSHFLQLWHLRHGAGEAQA